MAFLRSTQVRVAAAVLLLASIAGVLWAPNPINTTVPPGATAPAPTSTPGITIDINNPPGRQIPAIPFTDVNPVGANFFLDREVENWKKEQTVRMAKEAGVGWMKQIFAWEEIEPRKGYFFDDKFRKSTWEKYDQIVDLAEQNGIRIIARLDRPPAWARPAGSAETAPPSNLADYGDFVFAFADHYKGRIQYFQVWNEPNLGEEWTGRPNAAGYVELLKIGYQRIKEADPNAVVLSAPLAQTLEESAFNLTELKFIDQMYQAGAQPYFDVLSANAYGFEFPPDADPDPATLNFSRLQLMRQVMEKAGDANKPIWFNEFGWNASPETMPKDKLIWRRVPEEQQAQYTADAIRLTRQWGWVGVLNIWFFRQVGDISVERSDYYFRMVDIDFTPRLVFNRVKALHDELAVATYGAYEETATPADIRGRWQTVLKDGASGGRVLQANGEGAAVTFSFDGTGLYLVVPKAAEPIRLLAKIDGKDQAAVDIPAGAGELVAVSGARNLRPGVHTLELTQVSGPAWAFDRFIVELRPDFTMFYLLSGTALMGVAVLIISFALAPRPR